MWRLLIAITIFSISVWCESKELSNVFEIAQKTCGREQNNFVVLDATTILQNISFSVCSWSLFTLNWLTLCHNWLLTLFYEELYYHVYRCEIAVLLLTGCQLQKGCNVLWITEMLLRLWWDISTGFPPLLFSYISSHSKQSFTLSFRFALTSATQSRTKWKPLSFFSTVTRLCYQSQVRSVCEFVWDVLWIKAWCGSSLKREYTKDGGGKQGFWGLICGDGEGKIFFWVVKEQQ